MAELTIVGMGPGSPELLTLQAHRALHEARHLILRTGVHGVADSLRKEGISFHTLDELYDDAQDFEAIDRVCAKAVKQALRQGDVTYAVPGQGILSDGSVQELLRARIRVRILPGLTPADQALARIGKQALHAADGLTQIPAAMIRADLLNPRNPLIVTELDDIYQAGEVKLILQSVYGDNAEGIYLSADGVRKLPLSELDRRKEMDHRCAYYLPGRADDARMDFGDLLEIMRVLREQCPWDREQDHRKLRHYMLEEAYEAVDAIDRDDPQALLEELGDVLYQVVFHAAVGAGEGDFDMLDITDAICRKMISRHPSIFAGIGEPGSDDENWEKLKAQAHGNESPEEAAARVPRTLPALMLAQKIARYLPAEALELPSMDEKTAGNWLFAAACSLRNQGIDAELALRDAVERIQHDNRPE